MTGNQEIAKKITEKLIRPAKDGAVTLALPIGSDGYENCSQLITIIGMYGGDEQEAAWWLDHIRQGIEQRVLEVLDATDL